MRSITNSCLKKKLKICEKVLAKVVCLSVMKKTIYFQFKQVIFVPQMFHHNFGVQMMEIKSAKRNEMVSKI